MRKLLRFSLLPVLTIICSVVFGQPPPPPPPIGWAYMKTFCVTENSGTTLYNYPLKMLINTQTLIAAGQMNADGSDMRFGKDCAGATLFNYWIDSGINTANTMVWVQVDTLFASRTKTIFMYYGDTAATAVSNISPVFAGPFSTTDSISSAGATINPVVPNSQRGIRFQPNENIVVTAFGKDEPDGTTRYVTLFDFATQAQVQQIQVSGAANQYHYAALATPIWLTSGTQYVLELFQDATEGYYYEMNTPINSRLTYYDMRYCNGCTQNTFPTVVLPGYEYGFPDFLFYTVQAVSPPPTVDTGSCFHISGPSYSVSTCQGTGVMISDTGTGGSGSYVYTWFPHAGLNDSTLAMPTATPSDSQIYSEYVSDADYPCITYGASVRVNVNMPGTYGVTYATCAGNPFVFMGHTYTTTGIYTDTLHGASASGCDSIITLNLTLANTPHSFDTLLLCPHIPCHVNGHTYTLNGTYYDTIPGGGSGGCDSLVTTMLNYEEIPVSSIYVSVCTGETYTFNGQTYSTSGTYADSSVGTGVTGCDSLAYLVLTVTPRPNPVITRRGADTLTTGTYDRYQWLLNGSPIPGETQQMCLASQNGSYEVHVFDGSNCDDTSTAVTISSLGIGSIQTDVHFRLYPNPNDGNFTVEFSQPMDGENIEIIDALGRTVDRRAITGETETFYPGELAAGIYVMTAGGGSIRFTVTGR